MAEQTAAPPIEGREIVPREVWYGNLQIHENRSKSIHAFDVRLVAPNMEMAQMALKWIVKGMTIAGITVSMEGIGKIRAANAMVIMDAEPVQFLAGSQQEILELAQQLERCTQGGLGELQTQCRDTIEKARKMQ